jgi:hypothetical protein
MPSKAVGLSPNGALAVLANVDVSDGHFLSFSTKSSSPSTIVIKRTKALSFHATNYIFSSSEGSWKRVPHGISSFLASFGFISTNLAKMPDLAVHVPVHPNPLSLINLKSLTLVNKLSR